MKRLNLKTISLSISLVLVLMAGTTSAQQRGTYEETSKKMSLEFYLKFSDIYPERAAEYHQYIAQTRETALNRARAAKRSGNVELANSIAAEARNHILTLVQNINRAFPPTKVTIYGAAVASDIKQAKLDLIEGRARPGVPLHVYLLNGRLITTGVAPSKYDMPRGHGSSTSSSTATAGRTGTSRERNTASSLGQSGLIVDPSTLRGGLSTGGGRGKSDSTAGTLFGVSGGGRK